MALQFANSRAVTLVAGVSGSGKSTFALRYLVNAPLDVRFVFDLGGEYSQRLRLPAAREPFDLNLSLCRGWVLFDPETLFPGHRKEAFAFFCDWTFAMAEALPGRKVLIVDEAYRYQTANKVPPELEACVFDGRKRGLDLMFNIQAPNKLNNTIINELTEAVFFRLQSDQAVEVCEKFGVVGEELSGLPDWQFIARSNSGGELRGRIKV